MYMTEIFVTRSYHEAAESVKYVEDMGKKTRKKCVSYRLSAGLSMAERDKS